MLRKNPNKIKFWCYPELSILSVFFIVAVTAGVTWVNVFVENQKDVIGIRIVMSSLYVVIIIIMVFLSPQAFSRVIFTEKGILFKGLFRKGILYPYKKYRYVYLGQYFHGNMFGQGAVVKFIIFSQLNIATKYLYEANIIENSADIIKIRYSRKRYERIYTVVPELQKKKLKATFGSKTD